MRTDQYIGLSEKAQEWLKKNALPCFVTVIKEFPKDPVTKTITSERSQHTELWKTEYGMIDTAYGNDFPLYQYRLKDQRKVVEVVQASPWSSGPCYFLCLVVKGTDEVIPESKWTDEEMDEYL